MSSETTLLLLVCETHSARSELAVGSVTVDVVSGTQAGECCHVVFLADAASDILAMIDTRPVLTVSDAAQFVNHGGTIQLITIERKLRFSINRKSVARTDCFGSTCRSSLILPSTHKQISTRSPFGSTSGLGRR